LTGIGIICLLTGFWKKIKHREAHLIEAILAVIITTTATVKGSK